MWKTQWNKCNDAPHVWPLVKSPHFTTSQLPEHLKCITDIYSSPISLFTHNIIHLFITQIYSYEKCGVGNVEPTNKPKTIYDWYQSEQLSVGNRRWGLYLFWSPLLCVALHLFGDKYCRLHSCLLRLTHTGSKYYIQVFSTSLNAVAVNLCAAIIFW